MIFRVFLLGTMMLLLSACWQSEKPLLSEADRILLDIEGRYKITANRSNNQALIQINSLLDKNYSWVWITGEKDKDFRFRIAPVDDIKNTNSYLIEQVSPASNSVDTRAQYWLMIDRGDRYEIFEPSCSPYTNVFGGPWAETQDHGNCRWDNVKKLGAAAIAEAHKIVRENREPDYIVQKVIK